MLVENFTQYPHLDDLKYSQLWQFLQASSKAKHLVVKSMLAFVSYICMFLVLFQWEAVVLVLKHKGDYFSAALNRLQGS